MRALPISLVCLLMLAACGGTRMSDGTVLLGDDISMVPAGRDAGGCPLYVMSSRSRGALRLPFFRTANGDFTTMRAEAACGP